MILCVKAVVECKTRQACGLYFVYIVITSFIMVDGSVDFTEVEFQDILTFTHNPCGTFWRMVWEMSVSVVDTVTHLVSREK